jgi:hypothetical protein
MLPSLVTTVLPKPMPPLLVVQVTTQQDHDLGEQGGVRLWAWLTVDPDAKLAWHHQHSTYLCAVVTCVLLCCVRKIEGAGQGHCPTPSMSTMDVQEKLSCGLSAVDCLLWEWAVYGIEPALSFGFYVVDDALEAVCGHDIAEQDEL